MHKKRRVLVTGASRGIGRATALHLAGLGFDIGVHYMSSEDAANEVAAKVREQGLDANLLTFDIADRDQVRTVLEQDLADNGAYYGVVCNAGITKDNAFPALAEEEWDSVINTNLDGFYNVLHPLIMPMVRSRGGGRIVTLASASGLIGNRGQVNYSAAKAGIIGATKALAVELAKRKITVNCVAPGVIETDMTKDVFEEEAKKMIPMREFGQVDDVAAAIGFLMSDGARYITRQVLSVNGGMC